jgi:hypothetical protein
LLPTIKQVLHFVLNAFHLLSGKLFRFLVGLKSIRKKQSHLLVIIFCMLRWIVSIAGMRPVCVQSTQTQPTKTSVTSTTMHVLFSIGAVHPGHGFRLVKRPGSASSLPSWPSLYGYGVKSEEWQPFYTVVDAANTDF